MRVGIAEETPLEHLVRRGCNARHKVAGREGGLLHLGEVVLGVTVQDHTTNGSKGGVTMRPDLGDVERVEAVFFDLFRSHDLDGNRPGRILAPLDRLIQVPSSMVGIFPTHLPSFLAGEVLNPLFSFEVYLHPEILTPSVVPHERMSAVAVHVAVALGCTPVREKYRHLVN